MSRDPRTVSDLVRGAAERWGDRPFLEQHGNVVRTFADVAVRADRIAGNLAVQGVAPGDRVAVMLDNAPEYVDAWLGILRLGAVEVSLNTAFRGRVLAYQLGQSGTRCVVTSPAYAETLAEVLPELPDVVLVVVVGDQAPAPVAGTRTVPFEALLQDCAAPATDVLGPQPAMLAYTSGTTGKSKGVVLPHRRLVTSALDMVWIREIDDSDRLYTCLPLFHGNAKNLTTLPALAAGARLALGWR